MKRFTLLVSLLALLTGFSMAVSTQPTLAAPATDRTDSRNCAQYNGQTFLRSSQGFERYKNSGCRQSDGGPCNGTSLQKNGEAAVKLTCDTTAPTNANVADNEADRSGNTGDGSGDQAAEASGETYQDDALNVTCTTDNCDFITNYINPFIQLMSVLVGLAVVVGIVFGGIQVASSAGDPQKAANGKGHIRNALIGALAYVVLFAFLQFIVPGGVM